MVMDIMLMQYGPLPSHETEEATSVWVILFLYSLMVSGKFTRSTGFQPHRQTVQFPAEEQPREHQPKYGRQGHIFKALAFGAIATEMIRLSLSLLQKVEVHVREDNFWCWYSSIYTLRPQQRLSPFSSPVHPHRGLKVPDFSTMDTYLAYSFAVYA